MHKPIDEMNPEEFGLALSDPFWRLSNLYKIMTKGSEDEDGEEESKVVIFQMNWAQVQLIAGIHYRNIILKARQLGFTTLITILYLDYALFKSNVRCGIIADTDKNAKTIFRDKVRFAYDNLPIQLRQLFPLKKNSADELLFAHNNSSIRVSTSMRGGTIDYLHVSEFGKICARFPERAKEIVTGSFPAVPIGGMINIESTAEGQGGYFYIYTSTAIAKQEKGTPLSKKDFKFFFFPWWKADEYRMPVGDTVISSKDKKYFHEQEGKISEMLGKPFVFDEEQKSWYINTRDIELAGDAALMWREYPGTPEEAFQQSTEGCYYATQLADARKAGRITTIPHDPAYPVNTYWDIGLNDCMTIWFHQLIAGQHRFISYYENSGEPYAHYAKIMQDKGYLWGRHFLPHDGDTQRLGVEANWTPKQMLEDLGFRDIEIVPKIDRIQTGIQMTRARFGQAWFDEAGCKEGLAHLANYRKEWSVQLSTWKDTPFHDPASDGADSFRQWAQAFEVKNETKRIKRKGNWRTA